MIIKFIQISGSSDEKIDSLKQLDITTKLYLEGIKDLEDVINGIRKYKVPEKNFKVDLTIARRFRLLYRNCI